MIKRVIKKSGFTLVEVVIVMAVIAVLAVLIIGAINIARKQGTNTARKADVKTVRDLLEGYYAKNQYYPRYSAATGYSRINAYDFFTTDGTKTSGNAEGELMEYMSPPYPTGLANRICYSSCGAGSCGIVAGDYWLWMISEDEVADNHLCSCADGTKCGFASAAQGSRMHCPKAVVGSSGCTSEFAY